MTPGLGKVTTKGKTPQKATLTYKVIVEKIGHRDGFYS
jgi:hypothetical protein